MAYLQCYRTLCEFVGRTRGLRRSQTTRIKQSIRDPEKQRWRPELAPNSKRANQNVAAGLFIDYYPGTFTRRSWFGRVIHLAFLSGLWKCLWKHWGHCGMSELPFSTGFRSQELENGGRRSGLQCSWISNQSLKSISGGLPQHTPACFFRRGWDAIMMRMY